MTGTSKYHTLTATLNTRKATVVEMLMVRVFGWRSIYCNHWGELVELSTYRGKVYFIRALTAGRYSSALGTVAGIVGDVFMAVGVMSVAGFIGLYCSGFFTWLAKNYPENHFLQLLS